MQVNVFENVHETMMVICKRQGMKIPTVHHSEEEKINIILNNRIFSMISLSPE